jgi:hypothetical protein
MSFDSFTQQFFFLKIKNNETSIIQWSYGVVVITLDFESGNMSSNLTYIS